VFDQLLLDRAILLASQFCNRFRNHISIYFICFICIDLKDPMEVADTQQRNRGSGTFPAKLKAGSAFQHIDTTQCLISKVNTGLLA
jgi:hypothetical protein